MTIFNPSPQPIDKDLLRQREIAAQTNALHAPLATIRVAAARRLGDMKAGLDDLLIESAHLLNLFQRWQQSIQTLGQPVQSHQARRTLVAFDYLITLLEKGRAAQGIE